jgi:2-polyprenyl-6-hydroxyphenyl methylase/3-demethylubiquinone-9 3-methyltransferase
MIDSFFSKPFFEVWLKQTHPKIKEWLQKEIEYLKENIKPNSKILDIGCGFGRHIEIIADFSKEVVGIDDNKDMIQKAKDRLSNFKNVNLFIQNVQNLKFQDDYFDYVICMTNTFGDFPEIKLNALKEIKRVCKKNGKIIISVYNNKSLEIRKKDYEKIGLHVIGIKNGIICTKEGLISEQFTKSQLKEMFDKYKLKSKILELNSISLLCELQK